VRRRTPRWSLHYCIAQQGVEGEVGSSQRGVNAHAASSRHRRRRFLAAMWKAKACPRQEVVGEVGFLPPKANAEVG
jgi:hypothetical protein